MPAPTPYKWSCISFNSDNKKSPGVMMKMCWMVESGERVATTLQKIFPKCIKDIQYNLFPHSSEYKAIVVGIKTYCNILIKNIINLRESANQWAASYHVTPMWQSNVSDFPQQVFKASSLQNLLKFLIKLSFMNWQMYMRSIYWQALLKDKTCKNLM